VIDEYRQIVLDNIRNAIENGGDYNFIYAQKRFNNSKVIWLRAIGKITMNDSNNQKVFSGIIIALPDKPE
jgi:hypothetical protein